MKYYTVTEVAQSCLTLCDPMDCSLPGSSVHEILQARVLEWVAISFSRGSSPPRNQTWSPALQADSFPTEPREAQKISLSKTKKSRMTISCTEQKDTSETWSEKCDLWDFSGLTRWRCGEEPSCWSRRHRRWGFNPWVGKIPWSRKWQTTPVFLPGKTHEQRSLVGYSP